MFDLQRYEFPLWPAHVKALIYVHAIDYLDAGLHCASDLRSVLKFLVVMTYACVLIALI